MHRIAFAFVLALSACGPLDPDIKQAIIDRLSQGGSGYMIPDYSTYGLQSYQPVGIPELPQPAFTPYYSIPAGGFDIMVPMN